MLNLIQKAQEKITIPRIGGKKGDEDHEKRLLLALVIQLVFFWLQAMSLPSLFNISVLMARIAYIIHGRRVAV